MSGFSAALAVSAIFLTPSPPSCQIQEPILIDIGKTAPMPQQWIVPGKKPPRIEHVRGRWRAVCVIEGHL
jgi:hypothetical protein